MAVTIPLVIFCHCWDPSLGGILRTPSFGWDPSGKDFRVFLIVKIHFQNSCPDLLLKIASQNSFSKFIFKSPFQNSYSKVIFKIQL